MYQGSISSDSLWSMLTPEERNKFINALQNPSSELTQQLLASEEINLGRVEPWWEAHSLDNAIEKLSTKRYGSKPEVMPMPSAKLRMRASGSPLLYNICALW